MCILPDHAGHSRLPRRGRTSGFTLMEVLVALLILSIGMLGVAASFLASTRAASEASALQGAVQMAVSELEQAAADPQRVGSAVTRGRYSSTLTYEAVGNDLLRITITVRWQERGELRSYRLARLLLMAAPGP